MRRGVRYDRAVHITFDDLVIAIASNIISESNIMIVQKLQS